MALKIAGLVLVLLLVGSAIAGWAMWIPFVLTAVVLIGIIFLK